MTEGLARGLTWVESGGLFALPNLRGGGEYGERWHRAGMLEHKQNVFDDFHAAAEALVAKGWTSAKRLGISGGSNGGLLTGARATASGVDSFTWDKSVRAATSFTGSDDGGPGGLWNATPAYHWAHNPPGTAVSYLTAVLDNIDNGVFLLDAQRKVIFANQALADMFGVTPDSLIGKQQEDLVGEAAQSSSDPEDFLRRLRIAPTGAYALRGEFEMERPRRRFVRWMAKPIQLGDGVGQLGVLTDMTAEMDLIRERDHLARTDPITGLMNRRAAEEVLEREASRAQRFGSRISVALIDLDHFKQVNDRFGHAAGDDALRATAQVLTAAMRGVDVAARWGGDELLAILPATGLEGARSFGERVRAAVEGLGAHVMRGATLSVGVAELQPGEDWADAVRRADAKLYEAKDAGRNRVA